MLALFKHAKNFVVSPSFGRPLFEGIFFDGKRAIASNTHAMIVATNFPTKPRNIHYKTGELIEGKYPDIDKAIPKETANNIGSSDITSWLSALKIAMTISNKGDYRISYFSIVDGALRLKTDWQEFKFEAILSTDYIVGDIPNIYFNTKYLYDALLFFKDANVGKFALGYNTPLAPMKLTDDKEVMAVITPVRVN